MLSYQDYINQVRGAVDNPGAKRIFEYLSQPERIAGMCFVSDFELPAISAVARCLEQQFCDDVDFPLDAVGNRQQVGRMIRYILSEFGYEQARSGGVRIKDNFCGEKFRTGTLYHRVSETKLSLRICVVGEE